MAGPVDPRGRWGARHGPRWVPVLATVLVLTGLSVQQALPTAAASAVVLVLGSVSLRLARKDPPMTRSPHAVDRVERAVECDPQRTQPHDPVVRVEMRAVEAEATSRQAVHARRRVDDQIAEMDRMFVLGQEGLRVREQERVSPTAPAPVPVPVPVLAPSVREQGDPHPEWQALEPDLISSLMAWEQHAARVAEQRRASRGRHAS